MPRYKAVLFDIDDTILKTREPKWRQHTFVAQKYYGIDLNEAKLRENWGKPFDELTEILYQGADTPERRRSNFIRHELEFPKEYEPYALETIGALHSAGIALGLMTSMYLEGAMIDLKHLQVPLEYFIVLQGSEATKYHKPDGRVFEPALATLAEHGIRDATIVYVGEALSDFQAAKDSRLEFIGITQGRVSLEEFKSVGVDKVFNDLRQFLDFVLE